MLPIESQIGAKVFISYAHADHELRKKLEEHLSSLKYSGEITLWQDQEIPAGANWEDQINTHLNEADLILLLISASFIASKYCWNKEVRTALERHKRGEVRVIPIVLRSVHWQNTPLGQLQALPTGAKPITQWNDQDAAFEDVVQGIRDIVTPLLIKLRPAGTTLYTYQGHSNAVSSVAWSPNGASLASGCWDNTVRVWDVPTGKLLLTYQGHSDYVLSVAWSPDGRSIASGSRDKTVQVWDAATGKLLLTNKVHRGEVLSFAWSPDGTYIASGGWDQTVQVWSVTTGHLKFIYRGHQGGSVFSMAWSPDGRSIASAGTDEVQIWDATTGNLMRTYPRGYLMAWSPDSMSITVVTIDRTVQVWDVVTNNLRLTYQGHSSSTEVRSVAWSPDGKSIASAGTDEVRIWDATTGKLLLTYQGHSDDVLSVAWSPNSTFIASGGWDQTIQVWKVK